MSRLNLQTYWFFSLLAFAVTSAHAAGGNKSEDQGKFYGAMETEYPAWFKEGFNDFKADIQEAKTNGKRLMVVFTQNGCPYCHALVDKNLSQKDIETYTKKNFDVITINMWGDKEVTNVNGQAFTEKSFSAALKVQYTPTILFFNEDGKIALRLNGYLPPDKFKVALEYVGSKLENKISYRDYLAKNYKPKAGGKSSSLHQQDFFLNKPYDLSNKAKDKPFAIMFEQSDCPNCDTLHNKVLVDKSTRDVISKFAVVQLDMWSNTPLTTVDGKQTTARELAKQLDVKYAPTIVVFNPQGKEIIRSEAFFKSFHTQGIFAYVLEGAYEKEPSFQRYLAARAEHFREQGKDVDIWGYDLNKPGS